MQAAARVVAGEPLTSTQGMPAKTAAWHGQQLPWQHLLSMTSACCCASMENELKEHRSRQRRKLLISGFHGDTTQRTLRVAVKEPEDGMDECASYVFLRAHWTRRTLGLFTHPDPVLHN